MSDLAKVGMVVVLVLGLLMAGCGGKNGNGYSYVPHVHSSMIVRS